MPSKVSRTKGGAKGHVQNPPGGGGASSRASSVDLYCSKQGSESLYKPGVPCEGESAVACPALHRVAGRLERNLVALRMRHKETKSVLNCAFDLFSRSGFGCKPVDKTKGCRTESAFMHGKQLVILIQSSLPYMLLPIQIQGALCRTL
jgi:hypothetical protein